MANYRAMYDKLFHAQVRAEQKFREGIEILQVAQQQTEKMFMAAMDPVEFSDVQDGGDKRNVE